MKANRNIIPAIFVVIALAVMTGCEYKSPTAMYFQPHAQTLAPVISGISPEGAALGGVNYITIAGSNFSTSNDSNVVYFSGYQAEVVQSTPTSIKVRRPNKSGDSLMVKIVTYGEFEMAAYGPYKISSVYGTYGGFLSTIELSAISADKNGDLYIIDKSSSKTVFKIAPGQDKETIGTISTAGKFVTDMVENNGKLIFLMADTKVRRYDLTTNLQDTLATLPKKVSFGDFDRNGNFYAGGVKTDLCILKTDLKSVATGLYTTYTIRDVRVNNDYVYVLAESGTTTPSAANPAKGIWRQQIMDNSGTLGPREVVLDWSTTGDYATSTYSSMEFSNDGKIYITTDNANPIMSLDNSGAMDVLYKGILPSPMTQLVWGIDNYLYAFQGTTWFVDKIDMGQTGSPHYGQ